MIDFTTHELELIGDSIAFELGMPLLDANPSCPRALRLRKIQSRIECFLEAKEAAK